VKTCDERHLGGVNQNMYPKFLKEKGKGATHSLWKSYSKEGDPETCGKKPRYCGGERDRGNLVVHDWEGDHPPKQGGWGCGKNAICQRVGRAKEVGGGFT